MIQMSEVIRELKQGIESCIVLDDDKKYVECDCQDSDENSFIAEYFDYETKEKDKYRIIVEKL